MRREKEREAAAARGGLPWPLYLVASCLVAIAAVRLFLLGGVVDWGGTRWSGCRAGVL